jgi:acetoin utilization protein AcuC
MFAGTVQLAHVLDAGRVRVGFAPQGAKHHAMADRGSGFCVFNDMAWAARWFAAGGRRVLYVDIDAHHGDGVEALTRDVPGIVTFSVHDGTIFPGTGHTSEPSLGVHNVALARGSGDAELLAAVDSAVELTKQWQPDVVLIAVGANGHETDPLSSLQHTYDGYRRAGNVLGATAGSLDASVLMGGAGGYQPRTHTPAIWATFVGALQRALQRAHQMPTQIRTTPGGAR